MLTNTEKSAFVIPYETDQLIRDNAGNIIELPRARPRFLADRAQRSLAEAISTLAAASRLVGLDSAERLGAELRSGLAGLESARRDGIIRDMFTAWALTEATKGRPENELIFDNFIKETGVARKVHA
jgi:hypothetical protein